MKTNLFENIPISEKKKTNTVIAKDFLIYFNDRYTELFGVPAKIVWEKDVKLIASIFKTYNDVSIFYCETKLEFLIKACEKYFISKDMLALKSAWSVGVFYTNISKLVLLLKHEKESNISPIIEGYKLAYFNHIGVKYETTFIGQEEVFLQLYLYLKPLWKQYGDSFTLLRFSEIFFIVLLNQLGDKEYNFNYFYSKYAQDFFIKWLETEGKETLMFFPKEVGKMDKEKLEIEQMNLLREELNILENYK